MGVRIVEQSGVWVSKWARFASGFHNSRVWDSHILRGPSGVRGRGTTALPFRVKLGLEGSSGTVVAAVPGFAALGLSAGQPRRLPMNVEVGVEVIVPGSWETGRCFLRAPLTHGVALVSRGVPRVVLTSGGRKHGVLVSRGSHKTRRTRYT